jgi:hypothetical protein
VAVAESEIGPTIPTLGLVVCTSGVLLKIVAAADEVGIADVVIGTTDVESVGVAENTTLEPDNWTESAVNDWVILAPRVAIRPPSVERAEPVFV